MAKHYHLTPAQINRQGGNPDIYVSTVWKVMLDLANMVLYEQAELDHDSLMIFNDELNKVLKDYSRNKDEYAERLDKMHKETGIRVEMVGGHVFTIDDTKGAENAVEKVY